MTHLVRIFRFNTRILTYILCCTLLLQRIYKSMQSYFANTVSSSNTNTIKMKLAALTALSLLTIFSAAEDAQTAHLKFRGVDGHTTYDLAIQANGCLVETSTTLSPSPPLPSSQANVPRQRHDYKPHRRPRLRSLYPLRLPLLGAHRAQHDYCIRRRHAADNTHARRGSSGRQVRGEMHRDIWRVL